MESNNKEIKIDFNNIEGTISTVQELKKRAVTCTSMKLNMSNSKGDAKTVLLEAYSELVDVAEATSVMLGTAIEHLDYAKTNMKEEDERLAKKMANVKVYVN